MAPATDAEPQRLASGCTSDHSAKMTPTQRAELGSKHVSQAVYSLAGKLSHGGGFPLYPLLTAPAETPARVARRQATSGGALGSVEAKTALMSVSAWTRSSGCFLACVGRL